MTQQTLKTEAMRLLKEKGIESNALEADVIVKTALGIPFSASLSEKETDVSNEEKVFGIIEQRVKGVPLQYLAGIWEFYGLEFYVGPGVLIPRQDTETLCEAAIGVLERKKDPVVIDLCSGSGCIAVTLSKRVDDVTAYAVELSQEALVYLKKNNDLHSADVMILEGDVLSEQMPMLLPKADLIVCNPPYLTDEDMLNLQREVRFEPASSLYGGKDGLDFYRVISNSWKCRLKENGVILFEVGKGQSESVSCILTKNGYTDVKIHKDLCGIDRVVEASRRGCTYCQ